jgi:ribonuclease HII
MHQSLAALGLKPEFIAVDGNRFHPFGTIPYQCVVKGDSRYMNIAAASVIAKTYRDDYMNQIHEDFPEYQWKKNKGYPTLAHREAIRKTGISPHHRKSFQLLPKQLQFDL